MNDFLAFLRDFFNFKIIIDNFKYFLINFSSDAEMDNFNSSFSAGIQKTLVLGMLIVANNVLYRRDQASVDFAKQIVPVFVSGFAVFIIVNFAVYLFTKSSHKARAASNILILHLIITLSMLLVSILIGFSKLIDDLVFSVMSKDYEVNIPGLVASYVLITILSITTTTCLIVNAVDHDYRVIGPKRGMWKRYLVRGLLVTFFSIVLIGMYVVNKLPEGQAFLS
jgi:hypothetical protein